MHCVLDLYGLLNNSHNRVDSEFPSDGAGEGGGSANHRRVVLAIFS